jgi:hypothetical protein
MPPLDIFSGAHMIIATILLSIAVSIFTGLAVAFMIFMLRVLLRRTWAAVIASFGLLLLMFLLIFISPSPLLSAISLVLFIGACLFVFIRFGLLSLIAIIFFYAIVTNFLITMQFSAWYSGIALTGLALLLAMTLYAFHTSLGGQPLFGRASLED